MTETAGALLWLENRGDGTFREPQAIPIGGAAFVFAAADFDGNGLTDFAVASYPGSVSVLRAEGQVVYSRVDFTTGSSPWAAAAADWSGDGLPDVACTHLSGVTLLRNLSAPPEPDSNDNGVLDICESTSYERGDIDASGAVELTDAVFLVGHLFLGTAEPTCDDAADANKDLRLDLSDAIYLLGYLFLGTAEPPFPFPGCAMEVDVTSLGCDAFAPCQ